MTRAADRGVVRRFNDSYGLVFLMIVATLLTTAAIGDSAWARALTSGLMGVTLLLTLHASDVSPRVQRAVAVLVIAGVAVAVASAFTGEDDARRGLSTAVGVLFVLVAPVAIARRLRSHAEITMRTIMGAVCIYLFIGLFFAMTYHVVELAGDEPFFVQVDQGGAVDFVYFSYVTQATVGYGDLTPATDLGRMLAVTEALVGQVYLVTVVALLVGNLGRARRTTRLVGAGEQSGRVGGGDAPPSAGPSGAPVSRDD